jgi:hypothetical protein
MAFVVTRTFGRELRYLQVDDWAGTPPTWLIDVDDATRFGSIGSAHNASKEHSGDSVLETNSG